jgi:hypothetical protein
MREFYPVEVWLPEEEINALDQACEVLKFYDAGSHSRFVRRCLLYGLLCLRETGVLQFPHGVAPEFTRLYDQMEAAHKCQ